MTLAQGSAAVVETVVGVVEGDFVLLVLIVDIVVTGVLVDFDVGLDMVVELLEVELVFELDGLEVALLVELDVVMRVWQMCPV